MKHFEKCSRGTFRVLSHGACKRIMDALFADGANLEAGKHDGPEIKVGNHAYRLDFVSYSIRYGSVSVYLISADGAHLIRVADHWSGSKDGRAHHEMTWCGKIVRCEWYLSGSTQPLVHSHSVTCRVWDDILDTMITLRSHGERVFLGGTIKLADLG